ncbi:hypothetical protein ACME9X_22170 (plasmid) [Escherichia coli]
MPYIGLTSNYLYYSFEFGRRVMTPTY